MRAALLLGLILLIAGCLPGVLAPAAASSLQLLRFEQLRNESTLNAEAVMTALQDQQGQMWLGTTDGLFRFDGRRARHFGTDPARADSLGHPHVFALLESPGGRLRVGTGAGLHEMDLRSETLRQHVLPAVPGVMQGKVNGLLSAPGGALWVLTPQTLLRFEPDAQRFTPIQLPEASGSPDRLLAMTTDGQGGLWLARGRELLRLDAREQLQQRLALRPGDAGPGGALLGVRALCLDGRGRVWVGTDRGVQVLDPSDGSHSDLPERLGLPIGTVYALHRDAEGSIWIGSGSEGLWRWREGAAAA